MCAQPVISHITPRGHARRRAPSIRMYILRASGCLRTRTSRPKTGHLQGRPQRCRRVPPGFGTTCSWIGVHNPFDAGVWGGHAPRRAGKTEHLQVRNVAGVFHQDSELPAMHGSESIPRLVMVFGVGMPHGERAKRNPSRVRNVAGVFHHDSELPAHGSESTTRLMLVFGGWGKTEHLQGRSSVARNVAGVFHQDSEVPASARGSPWRTRLMLFWWACPTASGAKRKTSRVRPQRCRRVPPGF